MKAIVNGSKFMRIHSSKLSLFMIIKKIKGVKRSSNFSVYICAVSLDFLIGIPNHVIYCLVFCLILFNYHLIDLNPMNNAVI